MIPRRIFLYPDLQVVPSNREVVCRSFVQKFNHLIKSWCGRELELRCKLAVILFILGSMEGVEKMTPDKEDNSMGLRRRLSCTNCFDALWFCYSPVHQMQQYYRLGVFDNCSGKWTTLFDCLNLKTKRPSEVQEILESREKAKSHIWTFRTPEEASSHWKELFGHLDEM